MPRLAQRENLMSIWKSAFVATAIGVLLHAAHAQPAPAPAAASAASAAKPELTYRSAFEGYRRYTDEPVVSWKETNDNVGRIGGWRAYAKEASGDPAADPHAGHGAMQPASGQTPPRAGKANTDKPFGQTETTSPPKTAPKPTPASAAASPSPAASQPASPGGHSKHH
jgi:hypothetical protein